MTSTMSSERAADTNYLLSRNEVEAKRLTQQYNFIKKILKRAGPLPDIIDPASVEAVMDVGAGNLTWTLDVARTPEIRSRLPNASERSSAPDAKPVRLYACDLSSAQFPPREVTDPLGITLFEHNVTEPFPPALHGTFDVVNMRLLVMSLSAQGWAKALANLRELLKPDGVLVLLELDPTWYRPQNPHELWEYNPNRVIQEDDWAGQYSAIVHKIITPAGFILDLPSRLPSMLEAASYTVISNNIIPAPLGALCKTYPSPLTVEDSIATGSNFVDVFNMVTRGALEKGRLHGLNGELVESEEARQEMIKEVSRKMNTDGTLLVWGEVVAKIA